MIKNNILGVLGHLFIVAFVFLFLSLVHKGDTVARFFYSGVVGKVFFVLLPVFFYWLVGKLMSRNTGWVGVLLPGLGIVAVAFFFSLISLSGLGSSWMTKEVGESMWRFPLELFLLPQYVILTLWGLPKVEYTMMILSLFPGVVYTFSILQGRMKKKQRKRKREFSS